MLGEEPGNEARYTCTIKLSPQRRIDFFVAEEVGHIFCVQDYALCSSGNNLNSLVSMSVWPGTEGKRKVPTRSEATVGEYQECLVAQASPPTRTATPSRGRTA